MRIGYGFSCASGVTWERRKEVGTNGYAVVLFVQNGDNRLDLAAYLRPQGHNHLYSQGPTRSFAIRS